MQEVKHRSMVSLYFFADKSVPQCIGIWLNLRHGVLYVACTINNISAAHYAHAYLATVFLLLPDIVGIDGSQLWI